MRFRSFWFWYELTLPDSKQETLASSDKERQQQYNDEANDNKRIVTQRTNNKADDNVLIDVWSCKQGKVGQAAQAEEQEQHKKTFKAV